MAKEGKTAEKIDGGQPRDLPNIAAQLRTLAVPVESLRLDERNARKHSEENLRAIVFSLSRYGQQKPIVVDRDGVVIAGNGTLAAARSLGWSWIAASRTDLAGEEAKAFAIADNRTAELAEWENETLATILAELPKDTMEGIGFSEKDFAQLLAGITPTIVEDEVPEVEATTITTPGTLWILGEHRLLCGDSTNADDVSRVMNGQTSRLMVTDPPYGVHYEGGQTNEKKREKIQGDDNLDVMVSALRMAVHAVPSGAWYIWHAGEKAISLHRTIENLGYEIRALIVWNKLKPHYGAPRAHYCKKHEPCLYVVKDAAGFVGPSNECTVWDIEQPRINELHPTQKPIECMARAIRNHDAPIVYDGFLGSGTTLIAAQQLGRQCFGLELSSAYCDVIVRRWQKMTGEVAKTEDGTPFPT